MIPFPFALLTHLGHFTPTPIAKAEPGLRMWDPEQAGDGFRTTWVSQPRTLQGKG